MPATTHANCFASVNLSTPGKPNPGAFSMSFTLGMQGFAEQKDALFAITCQKPKQEFQVVTAKAHCNKQKSATKITTICNLANAVVLIYPTRIARKEEEVFLGEISSIILSMTSRYPGLLKAEIAKIYENCYKLEKFYKFCYLKDRKDKDRDENITFKHSQIKIKKVTCTLCDFRKIINICSDKLLNYTIIMVDLFGVIFFSLFQSFLMFYFKIKHLSQIYN